MQLIWHILKTNFSSAMLEAWKFEKPNTNWYYNLSSIVCFKMHSKEYKYLTILNVYWFWFFYFTAGRVKPTYEKKNKPKYWPKGVPFESHSKKKGESSELWNVDIQLFIMLSFIFIKTISYFIYR